MGAKIHEYEFSSGWVVRYYGVPYALSGAIRASIPKPPVPTQTVDYGLGPVEEPNENDPTYVAALAEHNQKVWRLVTRLFLDRGMLPLDDEQQGAVDALKAQLADAGVDISETQKDDRLIFLDYIAQGYPGESQAFFDTMTGIATPKEEKVAAIAAGF